MCLLVEKKINLQNLVKHLYEGRTTLVRFKALLETDPIILDERTTAILKYTVQILSSA